jgi:hypothetical protein
MRIPTPIPRSLFKWLFHNIGKGFVVLFWRLFLVAVLFGVIYLAATSPVGAVGMFLVTALIAWLLKGHILTVLSDIWHLRFASIKL